MSFEINLLSGEKKKLLTGGKYCPEDIVVTAAAPAPVMEKDVNFYDYDGTCLYAYTVAEAQALTELPKLPEHDGLICQGWNWDLDDVKTLTKSMVIGANYITDDGKTRIYITLSYETQLTVPLYIYQSVDAGVEIEWGDGSAIETVSGTGYVNTSHTYSNLGNYVIKLKCASGEIRLGSGVNEVSMFGPSGIFNSIATKIEGGSGQYKIAEYACYKFNRLKEVSFPNNLHSIRSKGFQASSIPCVILPKGYNSSMTYMFFECCLLEIVSLPKSQTHIENSAIRNCRSLRRVAVNPKSTDTTPLYNYGLSGAWHLQRFELPDNATKINTYALENARSLTEFTVIKAVTAIFANALNGCSGLVILRFLPTTPPTVENANAFTGIPATCIVEVPAESLEAYQNATNYSGIAAQMVGV